jgi:acetamidase/formamidase
MGDSHAVQGDGEISLTALEARMKELRIQVISAQAEEPGLAGGRDRFALD